jgi:hypothetical protein
VGVFNHRYFIIFLGSLVASAVSVLICTVRGLMYLKSQTGITKNDLFYELLPDEYYL